MSMPKSEQRALVAIAQQCAETRRPIKTMIVMAALNVKTGAPADALMADLASLKRQGLITQHEDAWEATVEGHQAARRIMAGQAPATPKVEPISEPSKPRDTLRPRALTAPKPVTRQDPAPMVSQGASSTACDDQWAEERADIIGQNGPTGDHYPRQPDTDRLYEIAIELMKSATEAYQQALVLMQKGKHSDGQLLQLWANTLRTAGEQVGDEAIRLEGDA